MFIYFNGEAIAALHFVSCDILLLKNVTLLSKIFVLSFLSLLSNIARFVDRDLAGVLFFSRLPHLCMSESHNNTTIVTSC